MSQNKRQTVMLVYQQFGFDCLRVIKNEYLPPNTISASEDIFEDLKKASKPKDAQDEQ